MRNKCCEYLDYMQYLETYQAFNLTIAEFRILEHIARLNLGHDKETVRVKQDSSFTKEKLNISRNTTARALQSLVDKGFLHRTKKGLYYEYSISFDVKIPKRKKK